MNTSLALDKIAISEIIQGWMFRDLGQWDRLRTLFHPEGTIEVTWFAGRFEDFVDASMRMGASDIRTKHVIGTPIIRLNGHKGIAETNIIIVCDNSALQLGCEEHARYLDLVEKRDEQWKILKRHCLYDMGTFTFPFGSVDIDRAAASRHPREYAALAYLLEKSGFPVARRFPTRGSDAEKAIRILADAWLEG